MKLSFDKPMHYEIIAGLRQTSLSEIENTLKRVITYAGTAASAVRDA